MITISLKDGVSLAGLSEQMADALPKIARIYRDMGVSCVITSANDGVHMVGSLHSRDGICNALDTRTRDLRDKTEKMQLRGRIGDALGRDFDVVLESDHLHIEFDPK